MLRVLPDFVNDLAGILPGTELSADGNDPNDSSKNDETKPLIITHYTKRKTTMLTALLAAIGGFLASIVLVSTLWYYTEIRARRKYSIIEVGEGKLRSGIEGKVKYGSKVADRGPAEMDESLWNKHLQKEEEDRQRFEFQDERKDSLGSIGF